MCRMQLFVSVIIDAFALTEGTGWLTKEQSLMNDMRRYFKVSQPTPKPPVPDGWRSFFYHFFLDIRPLPIKQMDQCIESKHMLNNRFVADANPVRRQVEVVRQGILAQTDPQIIKKMTCKKEFLEKIYQRKLADIMLFECFSKKELQAQPLPPGCLYICGCWFDTALTVCIVINVVFMCSVHRGQSDDWEFFIWLQNLVFLLVFTAEMTIKMLGMGCKTYWYSGFDAFDGFTVLVGWAFAFLDMGPVGSIFRIGRVFRIVKRAPKLHNLMSTLVSCLPSISNVFMTLMLLFFVFAVIAVELFGEVRYGVSLNVVANFGTWSAAMHALWRCALGNWRGLMYDVQVVAPDCTMTVDEFSELPDGTEYNECGDYFTSCIFFVFFQVTGCIKLIVCDFCCCGSWQQLSVYSI